MNYKIPCDGTYCRFVHIVVGDNMYRPSLHILSSTTICTERQCVPSQGPLHRPHPKHHPHYPHQVMPLTRWDPKLASRTLVTLCAPTKGNFCPRPCFHPDNSESPRLDLCLFFFECLKVK